MAYTITDETRIYNGVVDTVSGSIANQYNGTKDVTFTGFDGNEYQVLHSDTGGNTYLYRIDRENVTRTLVQTITSSQNISLVNSASGITPEGTSMCYGVLGNTKYLFFYHPSIFSTSTASIWKVNSSGSLVCEAAVSFTHGSVVPFYMARVICCGLMGNQTEDDSIVCIRYNWSGDHYYDLFWANRFPSINQFKSLNGTNYGLTVWNMNQADIAAGDLFTHNISGNLSATFVGWLVPGPSGTTRWYFYLGPAITLNSSGHSTWIYSNYMSYGSQLTGYIPIGNSGFSTTTYWSPGTTKTLDLGTMMDNRGGLFFPRNMYDADGTSYSSDGAGDYNPAATVKKISSDNYLVILGASCDTWYRDQYGSNPAHDLVSRYAAFTYTPSTGKHVLIAKQTFQPCFRRIMYGPGASTASSAFIKQEISFDYDATLNKFYHTSQYYLPSVSAGEIHKNIWGVVGPAYDQSSIIAPCFLTEIDATYADFVAKYP